MIRGVVRHGESIVRPSKVRSCFMGEIYRIKTRSHAGQMTPTGQFPVGANIFHDHS